MSASTPRSWAAHERQPIASDAAGRIVKAHQVCSSLAPAVEASVEFVKALRATLGACDDFDESHARRMLATILSAETRLRVV